MNKKLVELCVKRVTETDRAMLVSDGGSESAWLPKSQLTVLDVLDENEGMIVISVPEWLAIEKELV